MQEQHILLNWHTPESNRWQLAHAEKPALCWSPVKDVFVTRGYAEAWIVAHV
jgi:hypothetical protein